MTKIDEAYAEYHEAEVRAAAAYEQYWIDRCKQENIIFRARANGGGSSWPYCNVEAQVGPHLVRFETNAKKFEGAYFYVQLAPSVPNGYQRWKPCKVKSERGWEKLLRRLSAPTFV